MTEDDKERRSLEEARRRREAYDIDQAKRWKQQQESDEPATYDPWTGHYF